MDDEITFEEIREIIGNTWVRKVLDVSVELEIYSKIKKGIDTAEKIAQELNTNTEGVRRLLNGCVSIGLIKKSGDRYENTKTSEKYLIKDSPEYYGDFILMNDVSSRAWDSLKEVILNGHSTKITETRFEEETFTKAMHNNAVRPANSLAKEIDFSKYNKLLDIGGGSGVYSIILTNHYSNLNATVFDLPEVCKTTKQYIEKLGDTNRVNTFAGNMMTDNLPKGYDVALISQVLHSYNPGDNKKLLKEVYDILPEGGLVIINEFLLNPDRISPIFPTLFSINMFIRSKDGSSYTEDEITEWLEEIGFEKQKTIHLGGPVTSIIAKK